MKFKDWDCAITKHEYDNARTALVLVERNTGEQIAVATVNLPDTPNHIPGISKEVIFIKDWSENEGMFDALVGSGMIHPLNMTVPCGYVDARVATMSDKLEAL